MSTEETTAPRTLHELQLAYDVTNGRLRRSMLARQACYRAYAEDEPALSLTLHAPRGLDIEIELATLDKEQRQILLAVLMQHSEAVAVQAWRDAKSISDEATAVLARIAAEGPESTTPGALAEAASYDKGDNELAELLADVRKN